MNIKRQKMLRLIREYNGGAILAHHNMYPTEFNDGIRSAISTNTAIKYASAPAGMDISYMARDMHCEPEFLTKTCVKTATHARFGCFVTGMEHPFLVEVPFLNIEKQPQMPEAHYRARLEMHRIDYGVTEETSEPLKKEDSGGRPGGKKGKPPGATKPVAEPAADPHTGEHTEPASKWGS